MLTGCRIAGREIRISSDLSRDTIFRIGDLNCSINEFRVYLANYKNLYGTLYETDFWENAKDSGELGNELKKEALMQLTEVYTLCVYASGNDITLTEDEIAMCDEAAKEYYDSLTKPEISYMGVSENELSKMYQNYALAQKAYSVIMKGIDFEVSEDEARIMDAELIFTTEKAKAREAVLKAREARDFASVASTYTELPYVSVSFGRGEYPENIEKVVFNLENGEHSNVIEGEDGYYVFYCVNKYDEELSEKRKDEIYNQRINEAMDEIYSYQKENAVSLLNDDLYAKTELDTSSDIATDTFFEIYREKADE